MLAHSYYPSLTITRFFEQHGKVLHFNKNDIILSANTPANYLYLIKSGYAYSKYPLNNQRDFYLSICPEGTIIGLTNLFSEHQNYLTTEMARTDVKLIQLKRNILETELLIDPILQFEWTSFTHLHHQKLERRLLDLLTLNKKEALYSTLLRLYYSLSSPYQDSTHQRQVVIDLTMQDLASLTFTTREMISKWMNDLKKNRIITWQKKRFIFLDVDYFKKYFSDIQTAEHLYQIF